VDRRNAWIIVAVVALGLGATISPARAAEPSKGAKLFVKNRCTTCHSVKAVGIEKKAAEAGDAATDVAKAKRKPPDLSGIGLQHDAAWFSRWLQKKETVEGKTHMKKFLGPAADLKTVTEWLASLKMNEDGTPKTAAEKPEVKPEEKPADKPAGK
jgi:cbb3-type cytochrome oxidase cytochrome c subunit